MSSVKHETNQNDEIKLSHLFEILWNYKIFIVLFTLLCSVATVFYAINKPNVYTARGIYMPKSDGGAGGLAKLAGQFGGLASLAGVNLGGSGESKTDVAIELLSSRYFLQSFIEKHDLVVPLLAVTKWDEQSDKLVYNHELYDPQQKKWVREAPPGKNVIPTSWEAYEFLKKSINVEYESKKGLVKISLVYYSPKLAAEWLELLVKDMNEFWKQKKLDETKRHIDLLTSKADKTQVAEIKEVFFTLIAEQTKSNLLAQATDESMFETVAEVIVPEEKSAPSRALLCIIGFIFSGFFACVVSLIMGFSKKRQQQLNG
ncbi:Wzz/FepE/Etk N-terminal domain-containing protein [Pseudoalteromonas sp. S4389]|uniref:Wzz/FepE/Etk N-terminal domain-containing protein n=1 Tax=Pseudoalteromonas sp. S4389 TaxID=579556 RepID=UPI0014860924|nr:Wzz/FepE/Etk N-terminal domain-containing protein [Pseudoalteromonas sp. S4389]